MSIEEEILTLLKGIGPGRMSSSAYDTAWVARLGEIEPELSNRALEWLSENQLTDGSWGAKDIFYYHDRVISTLASMIALTYRGKRARDKAQIERGLLALERITSGATQGLAADPNGATVGFEMIAPTLVAEAEQLGIIKQQGERILGRFSKQRKAKLSLIKDKKINRHITAAFSAEMAGLDGQSMLDIESLQEKNGSVGHSPSATAYYALYVKPNDEAALQYLRNVAYQGGVPTLIPFDVFESTWVLWNLSHLPNLSYQVRQAFDPIIKQLRENWIPNHGIGLSVGYSIPDGDDTSLVFEVLAKFNQMPDIGAVLAFEEENHFRTYHFEANDSKSVNIHALGALRAARLGIDSPSVQKILQYLSKVKISSRYWFDKWHLSPYYTTAHAIIACAGYANYLIEDSVEWIISTQKQNGAWGQQIPTAEETAYALQALCIWKRSGGIVPNENIIKGLNWLTEHSQPPYPPLWIGKTLYCPEFVVKATILSAIQLAKQTL